MSMRSNVVPEVEITSRWGYSFNEPGSEGVPIRVESEYFLSLKVGEVTCVWAGAPGTGQRSWLVTRIMEDKAYGVLLHDTIRILHPSEVR